MKTMDKNMCVCYDAICHFVANETINPVAKRSVLAPTAGNLEVLSILTLFYVQQKEKGKKKKKNGKTTVP